MTEQNETVCALCGSRRVFYDTLPTKEDPDEIVVLRECGDCGDTAEFVSRLAPSYFRKKSYVEPKITRAHEDLEEALEDARRISKPDHADIKVPGREVRDEGIGPMPIDEQERLAEEEVFPDAEHVTISRAAFDALEAWESEAVVASMTLAEWSKSFHVELDRCFQVHAGSLTKTIESLRDFIEREFDYSGGRMSTYKNRAVRAESKAKADRALAEQYKAELLEMKQERDLLAGDLGPRQGLLVGTAAGGVRLATDDEVEQIKVVRALVSQKAPPAFSEIKAQLETRTEPGALATLERLARLASTWDPDYITFEVDRDSGELLCLDVVEPSIPPGDGLNPINNLVIDLRRLEDWAAHHSGSRGVDHQIEWLQALVTERAAFKEQRDAALHRAEDVGSWGSDDPNEELMDEYNKLLQENGELEEECKVLRKRCREDQTTLVEVQTMRLGEQDESAKMAQTIDRLRRQRDAYQAQLVELHQGLEASVVRAVEEMLDRREEAAAPHEICVKIRATTDIQGAASAEEVAEAAREGVEVRRRESVSRASQEARDSLEALALSSEDQPVHAMRGSLGRDVESAPHHIQACHTIAGYTADRLADRITRHMELGGNGSLLTPGRAKWVASHILRALDEIQGVQIRRLVERSERAASWRTMEATDAAERLHRIVTALRVELESSSPDRWELRKLFADVANFAMFGFDVVTNGKVRP